MSRPALSPVTHTQAAEHWQAFRRLVTPLRRLGIKLTLTERPGANPGERLLVARQEFAELFGLVHELELRLPHPDARLSAPRLVLRMGEADALSDAVTITYLGDGTWRMSSLEALSAEVDATTEAGSPEPSVGTSDLVLSTALLVETALLLGGNFLGTHFGTGEERLAHARALTRYWQLRDELRQNGLTLQRPADGGSVTKCRGSFRRSPMRGQGSVVAIIETSKPSLRPGRHTHPCLVLRIGVNGVNAFRMMVHPSVDGDWIVVAKSIAHSNEAAALLEGLDLDNALSQHALRGRKKTPVEIVLGLYRAIG